MKREDISNLKKNRGIYMKVGLILSIGFAFMAFNYTIYTYEQQELEMTPLSQEEEILVLRTQHEQPKQLPPPAFTPSEDFIPDDIPDFSEQPVPERIDPGVPFTPAPSNKMTAEPPVTEPPLPLPEVEEPKAPVIFKVVEEMPLFGDCNDRQMSKSDRNACSNKALLEYVYKRIKYPAIARDNDIEGTVVVQFVVERDGSASNIKIARDIGGGCGNEVLRVIKDMPNWTMPGMQRGRPVRVQFNLPVKFKLH